jgi:hypothetical protein
MSRDGRRPGAADRHEEARYLLTLTAGKEFHCTGTVGYDAVIGAAEGPPSGRATDDHTAIRPTLAIVLKMPRGAR